MSDIARVLIEGKNIDVTSRSINVPLLGFDNIDVVEIYIEGNAIPPRDFKTEGDRVQFGNAVRLKDNCDIVVFLKGNISRARLEKWIPVIVAVIALIGNLVQLTYSRFLGSEVSNQTLITVTRYGPVIRNDGEKKFIFTIGRMDPSQAPNIVLSKDLHEGELWFGLRKRAAGNPKELVLAGGPLTLAGVREVELDLPLDLAAAYFDRCDSVELIGLLLPARFSQSSLFKIGSTISINGLSKDVKVPITVSNNRCS